MDFSEFILEIKKRMKLPNIGDIQMRANNSASSINDKSQGVNEKVKKELADESQY